MAAKVRALSIYLLKKELTQPTAAVKVDPSIRTQKVKRGRRTLGLLAYRATPSAPPRWVDFFKSSVNPADFQSSSVSAVFVVRATDRLFALTFGHGRYLLAPDVHEEGFGLRVTLNSVSADRIRTIDRKMLDRSGRHLREQAARNIPLIEFGLDIDKDILCAVTGPPTDPNLGRRLTGADALMAVAEVELAELEGLLGVYLEQSKKPTFREHFPWVDNIREVKSVGLARDLDAEMVQSIQAGQLDRVWMAVPELLEWSDIDGFTYSLADDAPRHDDINLASYLEHLGADADLSVESLRRHRAYCYSASADAPRVTWPVYRCIYAEIDRDDTTFLLNGGRWYRVATNYIQEVNDAIKNISASTALALPEYSDASEREYNRRVHLSNPTTFALVDRARVAYGGGHSQIEFCDLYTTRKEIIHVKRYGGSGVLSHLFAQGAVSAAIFLNDRRFRREVNRLLPPSHRIDSPDQRPNPSEYEVAFAVASKYSGNLVLPFFSRVTLRSTYQQLINTGYRVTLTKIPVG